MADGRAGSRALIVALGSTLALGVVAGVVARGFVSPAQQAAAARPPAVTTITAPVRYGVLPAQIVLRANVSTGTAVVAGAPSDLGGASPVVTSVAVSVGQQIFSGQLLGTVAERPVFVMQGSIPAFRAMSQGTDGIDVTELQQGLQAAGYSTGADPAGHYGAGTAAAVLALYRAAGVAPAIPPGALTAVARAVALTDSLTREVASARGKLAAAERAHAPASVIAADKQALAIARTALSSARTALATARRNAEPSVPPGEVVFVGRLPARIVAVARPGTMLGQGSGGGGGQASPPAGLATIGSDQARLTAAIGPAESGQLRVGMTASVTSNTTGGGFRARITAVSAGRVVLAPVGRLPRGMAGQNVQVVIETGAVKALIVPVASLWTAVSGQTYVQVVLRSGRRVVVWVKLGLAVNGQQAVSPAHGGHLRPGEAVVVGEQQG